MPAIRLTVIGILALMLSGCGHLVSEKLTVSKSASFSCPAEKKLVIMPLADYSYVADPDLALSRNVAIIENLTDQLANRGYQVPVREDLLRYLAEQKIITVKGYGQNNSSTSRLENELSGDWSASIKRELAELIAAEQNRNTTTAISSSTALDQKTLAQIADAFHAKYVMRGRITKFEIGEETTWNPLKKGLIPVVIGGTSRSLFGIAKSETYDMLDQMVVGGTYGTLINRTYSNSINEPLAISSTQAVLAGAAVGLLSSQSTAAEARVELRLWVQSAETGEIVWTNRADVKVKPQTVFSSANPEKLYDVAINRAVASLVDDFAIKASAIQ